MPAIGRYESFGDEGFAGNFKIRFVHNILSGHTRRIERLAKPITACPRQSRVKAPYRFAAKSAPRRNETIVHVKSGCPWGGGRAGLSQETGRAPRSP